MPAGTEKCQNRQTWQLSCQRQWPPLKTFLITGEFSQILNDGHD